MRYLKGLLPLAISGTIAAWALTQAGAQAPRSAPATAAAPAGSAASSFADLVNRLSPAVVNISTRQTVRLDRRPFFPPGFEEFFRRFGFPDPGDRSQRTRRGTSLGSGFIISPDGYIVTNNHVISPSRTGATVDAIDVTLADRREYPARVVGRDEASDLALLKVEAGNLPYVRFGDSSRLRVGDWVVAIGRKRRPWLRHPCRAGTAGRRGPAQRAAHQAELPRVTLQAIDGELAAVLDVPRNQGELRSMP